MRILAGSLVRPVQAKTVWFGMALRTQLRHTLIRLGRIGSYPPERASAPESSGYRANEPTHAPKATATMQTTPLPAQLDGSKSALAKGDEVYWRDLLVTTDADVEVDSVTPKRMERLREIAERYVPTGQSS